MAKVIRYYAISPKEVLDLDLFTFQDLWNAITILEARDFLIQAKLQMLPHIKKQSRDKVLSEMTRAAFPPDFRPKNAGLTVEQLVEKMAIRGRYGR